DDSEDEGDEEDVDEADTEEDVIHEGFAEGSEVPSNGLDQAQTSAAAPARDRSRNGDRGRGRRDGRSSRFGRSDRGDRNDRPRHTGGAGERERSGGGRH